MEIETPILLFWVWIAAVAAVLTAFIWDLEHKEDDTESTLHRSKDMF